MKNLPKEPSTLLPNQDNETATTAHRRKILVFSFSLILALSLIGAIIFQYRIHFDEFAKFRTQIEVAITSKDPAKVTELMAKDFTIHQPETGGAILTNPKLIAPKIIKQMGAERWSDHFEDFENTRILYPSKGTLQLVFSRVPDGWAWTGVQSISPDELAYLSNESTSASGADGQIEYREIKTEEAQGDEPSL